MHICHRWSMQVVVDSNMHGCWRRGTVRDDAERWTLKFESSHGPNYFLPRLLPDLPSSSLEDHRSWPWKKLPARHIGQDIPTWFATCPSLGKQKITGPVTQKGVRRLGYQVESGSCFFFVSTMRSTSNDWSMISQIHCHAIFHLYMVPSPTLSRTPYSMLSTYYGPPTA